MEQSENLKTVQQLFEYFGELNIPGFLSLLNDDVSWTEPGDSDIPYSGTYNGKNEIVRFLGIVKENQQMNIFKVTSFCEGDNTVVAMGYNTATIFRTGKSYTTDWVYAFHFTDCKISQIKVYMDTLVIAKANADN